MEMLRKLLAAGDALIRAKARLDTGIGSHGCGNAISAKILPSATCNSGAGGRI